MENNVNVEEGFSPKLSLSGESLAFLKEISKWAKFLSVVGFVSVGFLVLLGIAMLFVDFPNSSPIAYSLGSAYFKMMSVVYFIIAALYVMPVYYLFQFSSKMSRALSTSNTDVLTKSFGYLKSHYKFIGIFTIICLATYVLFVIVLVVSTVLAAAVF